MVQVIVGIDLRVVKSRMRGVLISVLMSVDIVRVCMWLMIMRQVYLMIVVVVIFMKVMFSGSDIFYGIVIWLMERSVDIQGFSVVMYVLLMMLMMMVVRVVICVCCWKFVFGLGIQFWKYCWMGSSVIEVYLNSWFVKVYIGCSFGRNVWIVIIGRVMQRLLMSVVDMVWCCLFSVVCRCIGVMECFEELWRMMMVLMRMVVMNLSFCLIRYIYSLLVMIVLMMLVIVFVMVGRVLQSRRCIGFFLFVKYQVVLRLGSRYIVVLSMDMRILLCVRSMRIMVIIGSMRRQSMVWVWSEVWQNVGFFVMGIFVIVVVFVVFYLKVMRMLLNWDMVWMSVSVFQVVFLSEVVRSGIEMMLMSVMMLIEMVKLFRCFVVVWMVLFIFVLI